jgi:site-specific recombinase XerD
MSGTARQYGRWAGVAISSLGENPSKYTSPMIRRFVTACWRKQTPVSIEAIVRVLRHFIAFLSTRGLCDVDLEGALPRLRINRPAPPPFVLTMKDFRRTLKTADGRLRDRAMLLLMFRLGLRGSDVAGLRLHDVHWQDGTILVSGKNRREELLPLPQDVGDALLAYLRDERPRTESAHVFLRERAPHTAIGRSAINMMRRSAMERAGVQLPNTRAHLTRHSVATDLLRTSVPLSALQHLLRHRLISTTGTYCHVGQAVLRSVCQRWPK